jgi:hypothetical protein
MTSLETQFNAMRGSGRPEGGRYVLEEDGTKVRVPSVSTVKSCLHPRGLMYGHWRNGKEGREYNDWGAPAAEIGTFVHRMAEKFIHGESLPTPPEELAAQVEMSFSAFKTWWEASKFTVVATEMPLVSGVHRFGGTPDAILRDADGRLCLGDWKSSKALYFDYLAQIAAYALLWNEVAPENLQLTGGFHLVRFDKVNGDFEHRWFPELDEGAEFFLLLRRAYDLKKTLEARVK